MTLEIVPVTFGTADFEDCFAIRLAVFVQEQNVPIEQERDENDATARHFLARESGVALGTARVILKDEGATAKIGRVAVLPAGRGKGVGAALMRFIEAHAGAETCMLDAQIQALKFYEMLGYHAYGAEFLDAGIAHRRMRKVLV
jgi:predicted GNAT family N-acyltransferase